MKWRGITWSNWHQIAWLQIRNVFVLLLVSSSRGLTQDFPRHYHSLMMCSELAVVNITFDKICSARIQEITSRWLPTSTKMYFRWNLWRQSLRWGLKLLLVNVFYKSFSVCLHEIANVWVKKGYGLSIRLLLSVFVHQSYDGYASSDTLLHRSYIYIHRHHTQASRPALVKSSLYTGLLGDLAQRKRWLSMAGVWFKRTLVASRVVVISYAW